MFIIMFANYRHSVFAISESKDYLFCLIICLLAINKMFYSASIFSIIYDRENHPKHTKELFIWRLAYDFMIVTTDVYLYNNYQISLYLLLVNVIPLFLLELILYFLSVCVAEKKADHLCRFNIHSLG